MDGSNEPTTAAPVLDAAILMEAASDDRTEAADLCSLFFRLTAEQYAEMDAARARGDAGSVRRTAHRAAGGASTCGFPRLASALREIESAAETGSLPTDGIAGLRRELDAARTAAGEFLGKAITT